MHSFVVADVNIKSRLVALRDADGRYHVAHCTSTLPAVEDVLTGSLPVRGFSILIASDGGACRCTYSAVYRSQEWVLELLHPDALMTRPPHLGVAPASSALAML